MMMKPVLPVVVVVLVVFSTPIKAQQRHVLDLLIGAAALLPLGGKEF